MQIAGAQLVVYDSVGSTNAEALRLARAGESGPLWVLGHEQTAGRGRRGRSWSSPRGNLYASLLLTDACRPERAPHLSFVAAIALHDALAHLLPSGPTFQVKWPNDLVFEGAKVAGILVEGESAPGRRFATVIGIGVNCMNHPADTPYPATNLRAAGAAVTPNMLLPALATAMQRRLDQWSRGEGFEAIRADWIARAARLDEQIRLQSSDGDLEGRFEGIDQDGRLILQTRNGDRKVLNAGDVTSAVPDLARLREGAAL